MAELFDLIAAHRIKVADILDGLSEDEWNTPTLCEGWTARNLASHIVSGFEVSMPKVIFKAIKAKGDFNTVMNRLALQDARRGPEIAGVLRREAANRFKPPGLGPIAPLTDIVIHSLDLVTPLGRSIDIDAVTARTVLDFLMSKKATRGFIPKDRVPGLRFVAPNIEWSSGDGPTVSGSVPGLLLAITGRRAGLDDLGGEGLAELRRRVG